MRVGNLGEDLNFLYFLQNDKAVPMQSAFWEVDHRNPLCPWWYKALEPLILGTRYGIYVVRRLTNLLCAASLLLLIRRLGRGQYNRFAFLIAVLAMLWDFSTGTTNIFWTRLVADALALFALTAYCGFLDEDRRHWQWIVVSILLYFVAIGTYTLLASMPIAMFCLALFREHGLQRSSFSSRIRQALQDVAPFAVVTVLFLMIWSTTTTWIAAVMERAPLMTVVSRAFSTW